MRADFVLVKGDIVLTWVDIDKAAVENACTSRSRYSRNRRIVLVYVYSIVKVKAGILYVKADWFKQTYRF